MYYDALHFEREVDLDLVEFKFAVTVDVLELLIKNGADINARNKYNDTALITAIDKSIAQ